MISAFFFGMEIGGDKSLRPVGAAVSGVAGVLGVILAWTGAKFGGKTNSWIVLAAVLTNLVPATLSIGDFIFRPPEEEP